MARLFRRNLGWLVIEREHVSNGQLVLDVRVRLWHPGFWWVAVRTLLARHA